MRAAIVRRCEASHDSHPASSSACAHDRGNRAEPGRDTTERTTRSWIPIASSTTGGCRCQASAPPLRATGPRRTAGTVSGTPGGCPTGPSPPSSPGPGPPPWRWPTTPSPRPRRNRHHGGRGHGRHRDHGRPGCARGQRAAGHPFRRDHQRVRGHRDHHDAHRERQDHRHPRPARPGLPRQLRGMTMTTGPATLAPHPRWRRVHTGDTTVAVAQRNALGTTARIVVWPPEHAGAALTAVDDVLSALDLQASRFRPDSEISWLHRAHGGLFMLSDGLAEAIRVALTAAAWTGGLADPTIGSALISLGYDRDFAAIDPGRRGPSGRAGPGAGMAVGAAGRPAAAPARPGCCSTWAPRPRAWGPTARSAPSRPPPGTPGERWSAWAATSPPAGHRPRAGGRSWWLTRRACQPGPRGGTGSAGPAGPRGGGDLVGHLPRMAAGRPRAASHRGSPDRPAGGRPVADGERGRGDLR